MTPFTKLALVVLVVLVALWLVTRFRDRRPQDTGRPVPVQDLPRDVRETIDHQIALGRTVNAVKVYRDATKARLVEAKHAVDARSSRLR